MSPADPKLAQEHQLILLLKDNDASLVAELDAHKADKATLETMVSALWGTMTGLEHQIPGLDCTNYGLTAKIASLDGTFAALKDTNGGLQRNIARFEDVAPSLDGLEADLEDKVTHLRGSNSDLGAGLESKVNGLETADTDLENNIKRHESDASPKAGEDIEAGPREVEQAAQDDTAGPLSLGANSSISRHSCSRRSRPTRTTASPPASSAVPMRTSWSLGLGPTRASRPPCSARPTSSLSERTPSALLQGQYTLRSFGASFGASWEHLNLSARFGRCWCWSRLPAALVRPPLQALERL